MPYLIVTALVFMLTSTPATASDTNYCRPYAAKLTQTFINYVWNRAYTACLNVEGDDPLPPNNWMTAWRIVAPEADLKVIEASPVKVDLDKIGNVPATDAPKGKQVAAIDPTDPIDPVDPPPPPDKPIKQPKTKPAVVKTASVDPTPKSSGGAQQALCTKNNLRTVYNGHHWNCRK
jgi:hypothetical protein